MNSERQVCKRTHMTGAMLLAHPAYSCPHPGCIACLTSSPNYATLYARLCHNVEANSYSTVSHLLLSCTTNSYMSNLTSSIVQNVYMIITKACKQITSPPFYQFEPRTTTSCSTRFTCSKHTIWVELLRRRLTPWALPNLQSVLFWSSCEAAANLLQLLLLLEPWCSYQQLFFKLTA
jgi:hypothetical protein